MIDFFLSEKQLTINLELKEFLQFPADNKKYIQGLLNTGVQKMDRNLTSTLKNGL